MVDLVVLQMQIIKCIVDDDIFASSSVAEREAADVAADAEGLDPEEGEDDDGRLRDHPLRDGRLPQGETQSFLGGKFKS